MRFTFTTNKNNDNLSFDESSITEGENLQPNYQTSHYDDVLTIEGLRRQYNSCSDCGVCWYDDHVNLDCSQCGGYALYRPCPDCNGKCGTTWKRDVSVSHMKKKAEWVGSCCLDFKWNSSNIFESCSITEDKNSNVESYQLHASSKSQSFRPKAHIL